MLHGRRYWFLLCFLCWLLMLQPIRGEEGVSGNLVTIRWLEKHLQDTSLVIVDASPASIYKTKHIPGAFNYDIFLYGPREIPLGEIEKKYTSWGVSADKKVILYDQGGTYLATRLFFSLEHHGFPTQQLFIVDGGLAKWQESGLPVTAEVPATPKRGSFTITTVNSAIRCDLAEFLTASGDLRKNVLLDALDPGWHFGGTQFFDRAGHIPHAIMVPAADFFNADKTFKSAADIRVMLAHLGIQPEQHIYTHCGGGIAASVPYFALKFMLGYPFVKLYPGSQLEWVTDQRTLPLWTYAAPFLMREAEWLQTWGGRIMRMYGVSNVSIIDVRPAEVYRQGHVPFSINIPVSVFRENFAQPESLAAILGRAGVSPAHEAVIVSGSGVTSDAAFAFMALEMLGQKRVSIMKHSLETWAERGFPVLKDTSKGNPEKHQRDPFITPATYTVRHRDGVVTAETGRPAGLYPKVYLASGKKRPDSVFDAHVLHVPSADLLKPDGTPKAAKDLWTTFVKAGVSRYAELVCFSEDPGEAAVTYFILKLMGYPDVTVWMP